jgi:hypothetical protein
LLSEIIQLETMLGEALDDTQARQLTASYLVGEGIDYAFRTQKL